jgi:hypothetical protein
MSLLATMRRLLLRLKVAFGEVTTMRFGNVLLLVVFLVLNVGRAHAREHICETSSVHVSIENLKPGPDTPKTYSFQLKLTDSCPEDDELEGVFVIVQYSYYSSDCGDERRLGTVMMAPHDIIEPNKSHKTMWDPEFIHIPPDRELTCIWIGAVHVTGSYAIRYRRDGTEWSRD